MAESKAQRALRMIRALRSLPETSGTWTAERKILNSLNSNETLEVALELAADQEAYDQEETQAEDGGAK